MEFHDAVYFVDANGQIDIFAGVVDRQGQNRSAIWSFAGGQWTQMPMTLTNMRGQTFAPAAINHITMSVDPKNGPCASLSQLDDGTQKVGLLNVFNLVVGVWQPQWFSKTDWFITQGGYVQGVCIASDGRIYAGGIGLAQSAGGRKFESIATDAKGNSIHVDQHAIVAYADKIYVGTDGGLFRFAPRPNKPGVDEWDTLNTEALMNYLSTGVSAHPTNAGVVLVGNQDNGVGRRSGPGQWGHSDFSNEREKLRFDPDPANQGQYAYSGDPNNGFFSSHAGGVTFTGFQPAGVPAPDPPPPFALHPKNSARMMIGWMTVFETFDRGKNWNATIPLPGFPSAISYVGDHTAYVGAAGQLFQRLAEGANWTQVPFNFPSNIVSICPDAANPDAVYVATSDRVFRRLDPQAQWEDLTGNLNLSVNVMALLPSVIGSEPWLLVGTDAGVFITSKPNGTSTWWTRFGTGLPDASVKDLEITAARRLLLAATWGRGAWGTIIADAPQVIVRPRRDNCGIFAVEGGGATLDAQVVGLTSPLTYKWSATGTVIIGSDDKDSVVVASPPPVGVATVSVTVTDGKGAIVKGSATFSSIPTRVANLVELVCHIRVFPNFPIAPLWDPPRDLPVHGFSRVELKTLHGLAKELVALSHSLLAEFADDEPRGGAIAA